MPDSKDSSSQELLKRLTQAIGDWECSPYYLEKEELFDLERFLDDHQAADLKRELERLYGAPLNQRFWSSFLGYHRLKKAREEIKTQDALQEEKRRRYMEALDAERKAWQETMKEFFHQQRRERFRVISGGRTDNRER
ncbi:MAG: hypothetical protein GX422_14095 [Deltaproteobacteria bacterium]|nr:hypothetical protein [Deltaproteobacteria bacterium]